MKRCLENAIGGFPNAFPNPLVGAVLVFNHKVISEGYHRQYGGAHAEVNALVNITDQTILSNSTLYVNLEPCSHFGKTPPCADMIIEKGIKKVVVAAHDPNPMVAGQGIAKLKASGIQVITGVLEQEAIELNKRFYVFYTKNRPYIIIKFAQTADGYIANNDFTSKWISNEYSRLMVHKWRSDESAVLVGTNTAFYDNPELNNRLFAGRQPIRFIIDRNCKIPLHYNLFKGAQKTTIFNEKKDLQTDTYNYIRLNFSEDITFQICEHLFNENLQSVIIEGGSYTINKFVENNLWDEARVFTSNSVFLNGIKAPEITAKNVKETFIFSDKLTIYKNLI